MYLSWWMMFALYVWWVISVYAISTREKRKFFALGISLGIEQTLSRIYPNDTILNSKEHLDILQDILKSAKLPKDAS
jgi:hypothetical protein